MTAESNVAILVDCENAQPAVLEQAVQIARAMGRVTIRRGYGNEAALAKKWHDAMVRHGFAPCMQLQYVAGKNTADMALALDAFEMLFDRRADRFLIVTSDSDFVCLCHKLRERGAALHVLGEAKTPAALRNACERFHESSLPAMPSQEVVTAALAVRSTAGDAASDAGKNRPLFVVKAVRELSQNTPDGMIGLSELGNHLRTVIPGFSHTSYGYKNLRTMLEAYDLLRLRQSQPKNFRVGLAAGTARSAGILHIA